MYLMGVQDPDLYTCTYPYTVKGSRVYKPCNVLNVKHKVLTSLVWYKATLPLPI